MKKNSFIGRLLACLILAALVWSLGPTSTFANAVFAEPASPATDWEIHTVDKNGGAYAAMVLDQDGKPRVSYTRNKSGSEIDTVLIYARYTGTRWILEAIDEESQPFTTSIAVNPDGFVFISYYDMRERLLKLATNATGVWAIENVEVNLGAGLNSSIELTSGGLPQIAYWDIGTERIKFARKTATGSWAREQLAELHCPSFAYPTISLDLDSQNNPHVVYDDCENGGLMYMHSEGGEWSSELVDNGRFTGQFNSLELDGNDVPHISYRRQVLKYATYKNKAWQTTVVDTNYFAGVSISAITLDHLNRPSIAYRDQSDTGEEQIKYAYWDGIKWNSVLIEPATPGGLVLSISVSMDDADNPHIVYQDVAANDLKYTTTDLVIGGGPQYLPMIVKTP